MFCIISYRGEIIIQVVLDAGIRLKKFELVKSRDIVMDDLQELLLVA
jgi:hypothetical protein